MGKCVSFRQGPKGKKESRVQRKADPRLVELVRFLARQAAERDHAELLAELEPDPDQTKH